MSTRRIVWCAALVVVLAALMVIWIVVERRSKPWRDGEIFDDPDSLGYTSEPGDSGQR
jgi:hypothetical protein